MALSLNRASRGLLIDPTNGLADLTNHELRTTHNRVFYDDPSRLLRLIRFRVRFGFTVEERTQHQYENAREAQLEKLIPSRVLYEELEAIAEEPNAADVVRELERAGLLILFSSALSGSKLNLNSITKLERLKRLLPAGNGIRPPGAGPFLFALTEQLSPRERMVFELKHYHGMRLRTVAGMLNTTEGTIKNTLFRATHKLRTQLAEVR